MRAGSRLVPAHTFGPPVRPRRAPPLCAVARPADVSGMAMVLARLLRRAGLMSALALAAATPASASAEAPTAQRAALLPGLPTAPLLAGLRTGAQPLVGFDLTTHAGHFMGAGHNRLLLFTHEGKAFVRAAGTGDPIPWHIQHAYRIAGRDAQHAFRGQGNVVAQSLHQLALRTAVASA